MSLIPTAFTQKAYRGALLVQKASPNVMFTAGVVGVVAGTVLACRATLKLSEELPAMKAELELIKDEISEENLQKAVAYTYAKNAGQVAKLYAPAVLVGVTSVGLLTGSHITLNRRNAGLTAAYAAMSTAYEEYRDRVKTELGAERELDIYRNSHVEMVHLPEGHTAEKLVMDGNGISAYGRIFDEANKNWQKSAEMNRFFLHCQQNYINHILQTRGHVFLNEVYDAVGFERTKAGAVVGWLSDGEGDNYIDFGLFDPDSERFALGWERSVWLDFNVDGVIYDKI